LHRERRHPDGVTIVVPELRVPVELRLSPYAGRAEEACHSFLRDHALAHGPAAEDYLRRTRFGALVAGMYPDAYPEELSRLAEWMSVWSIVDDQLERLGAREKPEVVARLCATIASWLDGPGASPLGRAVHDVWGKIAATASGSWRRRLRAEFRRHLDGCEWEAAQVRAGGVPGVRDYLRWRPLFFGAYVALAMGEYAERRELPATAIGDPLLDRVVAIGVELMIISNDLLSADVEAEQGSRVNLVAIVAAEQHCSPQQSAYRLVEGYERRLAAYRVAFEDLRTHCEALDPADSAAVLAYARGPLIWTRGQIAWSTGNPRYSSDRAAFYAAIPDHLDDLSKNLARRLPCGT
jgi:germacradienol/geosmin synthase